MARLFKLEFKFLLGSLFPRKIPHLPLVANTFDFHSLELIFVVLVVLLWHLLLYLLYLLFWHGIFTCCTSYSTIAIFFFFNILIIIFTMLAIMLAKPFLFLLFLRVFLLTWTNYYSSIYVCVCVNTYKYIYAYMYVYENMLTHVN